MKKTLTLLTFAVFFCLTASRAQDHRSYSEGLQGSNSDILSLGLGYGQEYGGIGVNLSVFPQKNIGLFAGGGYALAGFGYNAGVKLRLLPNDGESKVHPFVEGMYGYNTAIAVSNASGYNKIFYGTTFGAGVDIAAGNAHKGYLSLAILVPIRSPDVQAYIDDLRNNYGVDFRNSLIPITFSFGYKIVLQ